jgi:hypothetical protein
MKKNIMKKIASISIFSLFSVQMMYILIEPTVATAASATDNVIVTLNVESGISITDGLNAVMTPNIGLVSNKSVGSSSWNVKTSSAGGYTLAVKASTSPALVNTDADPDDSFNDYTEAVNNTPDAWANIISGQKEFGFSGYGTDVPVAFGTATTCGNTTSGVPNPDGKFLGFDTGDQTLATRNTITGIAGITTNICFAAEQNGTYAASGAYTATITATATTI